MSPSSGGSGIDSASVARRDGSSSLPRLSAYVSIACAVGGRGALDLAHALLDGGGVRGELLVEVRLAGGDPALGLLLDAGDLGAGPLPDLGDVLVGAHAQDGLALLGPAADRLDGLRDVGVDLRQGLVAGSLGRRPDGRAQVDHQLGGLPRRRGRRSR